MGTKRFQVPSEGIRLQAILDTPDGPETYPLVIASHNAASTKDATFFERLVPMLTERGLAICRYDPRGFGLSEGSLAETSFWTRWLDLTAVTRHLGREQTYQGVGLVGVGSGALLGIWWSAVHPVEAVVCMSLPAPRKLKEIPRAMQDLLPPDLTGDSVVPHPTGVPETLLIYGENDREAAHADEIARSLQVRCAVVPKADRSFTLVKGRLDAFTQTADWLEARLVERRQRAHAYEHGEGDTALLAEEFASGEDSREG